MPRGSSQRRRAETAAYGSCLTFARRRATVRGVWPCASSLGGKVEACFRPLAHRMRGLSGIASPPAHSPAHEFPTGYHRRATRWLPDGCVRCHLPPSPTCFSGTAPLDVLPNLSNTLSIARYSGHAGESKFVDSQSSCMNRWRYEVSYLISKERPTSKAQDMLANWVCGPVSRDDGRCLFACAARLCCKCV